MKNVVATDASIESLTFLFFTLFIISLSQFLQKEKIIMILKAIFVFGFIIYFSLYLYSIFINKDFFGYSLWYGNRLCILAENPHQFVFFVGPSMLCGIMLLNILKFKNKLKKLLMFLFILGYLYMGMLTKSSTLYVTLFVILIYFI